MTQDAQSRRIFLGIHYLAVEETAIRINPAARTTDLLKKVFG